MRKRKRIIWISIIFIIGLILFEQFLKLNRNYGFIDWNSVNISVIEPLNKDKLLIYKGFYSINRQNDDTLFLLAKNKSEILYDGKNIHELKYEYGENDFLIIYNSEYYYQFRQFKTHHRAKHSYNFTILKSDTNFVVNIKISGIDGTKFERKMNKISNAKNLRCNTPKDKVGVIYNMKELIDK